MPAFAVPYAAPAPCKINACAYSVINDHLHPKIIYKRGLLAVDLVRDA